VGEEFADHEAYDEGDDEAACSGEGEAEEGLDNGLSDLFEKVAIIGERSVGAAKGQPEVEKKKEWQREKRNEGPIVARTEGEELDEDDEHEDRDKNEACARPVVIAFDWGLLRHAQVFQVTRRCGSRGAAHAGAY
jgi:hypothetical protein